MTFEEYKEGLKLLSREDLEEVCANLARSRDALLQRSKYWMNRCERAEGILRGAIANSIEGDPS